MKVKRKDETIEEIIVDEGTSLVASCLWANDYFHLDDVLKVQIFDTKNQLSVYYREKV